MLSICLYACETTEEAASLAESLSSEVESVVVLMQATLDHEAPPLICALTRTTATGNASTAMLQAAPSLMSCALELLSASDSIDTLH